MGCYNTCVVNAPVEQVWAALRNFPDLSFAPKVVTSLEPVGDAAGDQLGAKRVLNGAFHETLQSLNDVDRVVKYSIDDGPEAVSRDRVSGYIGVVRVFAVTDGNGTFVEWSSTWQDSQGGVKEFCDPIYKALLDSLKHHFEG